jgi:acyl-CoA dehydrogenase
MLESENNRRTGTQCAMTKMLCANVCMKITTEAVQVFGAAGLSRSFPVERLMRDAKAFQIYDGTTQIQKSIIGRDLQKSGVPFGFLLPEYA